MRSLWRAYWEFGTNFQKTLFLFTKWTIKQSGSQSLNYFFCRSAFLSESCPNLSHTDVGVIFFNMKKKFSRSKKVRKQKEDSGNKNEEEENSDRKSKQGSFCQFCGKKLRSRYQLKIHLAVHTGEKNYICGICKKGYQQKWNLLTHVARVHSKEKPFKCNECGKAFGYSSHFKRHVKTHFLEKINASDALKKIILNPHKCAHCEKSFESNYRLDLHLRTHSGARPCVCDKCGKSFTTKRLCDLHMKKKHESNVFVCEHCGETFAESKAMLWHLKTEHNMEGDFASKIKEQEEFKKGLIPCEVCGKTVMRSSVNKHLNIHYRSRVYLCRYCKKEFLESGQRMVHERKHTGEKPYICDICGRGHTQYGNLLTHRKRYHNLTKKTPRLWKRNQVSSSIHNSNGSKTKDELCSRIPDNEEKIQINHSEFSTTSTTEASEISKPQYTGNETIQEFLKKASSWVNEKFQESKHQKESDNKEPDKNKSIECSGQNPEPLELLESECAAKEPKIPAPKEIKTKLNNLIFDKILEDLLTTPAKEKVLQVVDTIQTNADVLREFLKKIKKVPDNIVMRTENGTLFWHCWMCESKLRSRHLLARHLIIHEPEENRPYRCDVCNKTFTQSNNFKEHKMSHLNENQYYCPVCWTGFRHKTHFNAHVKRHDPKTENSHPKKYECSYCDKKMHTKYQKKEHERTHTRERPFLCKVCGQQFGTSSTLHRHQFVHSNPTHQCDICFKLFKQKSGLKKHYDIHSKHPVKRVGCDCGKTFSQKHSLKKHKMICKNREEPVIKPFGCCICSKKFLTKSDLKRHVATHESVKRFTCPVCQGCLKTEETFKKHMRRHDDVRGEKKKPENDIETSAS